MIPNTAMMGLGSAQGPPSGEQPAQNNLMLPFGPALSLHYARVAYLQQLQQVQQLQAAQLYHHLRNIQAHQTALAVGAEGAGFNEGLPRAGVYEKNLGLSGAPASSSVSATLSSALLQEVMLENGMVGNDEPQGTMEVSSSSESAAGDLSALMPSDDDDDEDYTIDSSAGNFSGHSCPLCGHEAPSKAKLTIHVRKLHAHDSGTFLCTEPDCAFESDTFQGLVSHRKSKHHLNGNTQIEKKRVAAAKTLPDDYAAPRKHFRCNHPGCTSSFQSYSGLKYHKLLHAGTKDHRCDWPGCTAAFTNSSGLKIHKMTHDPATKAWKCQWAGCKAAFTTSSALSTHNRTHTGAKPYSCDWPKCGKHFARADHLKIHMRSHTNERPYVCEDCGKGFTNSSGLRTHEKTHRGDET